MTALILALNGTGGAGMVDSVSVALSGGVAHPANVKVAIARIAATLMYLFSDAIITPVSSHSRT
jgi:hypothetical protein